MEYKKWFSGLQKGLATENTEVSRSTAHTRVVSPASPQRHVLVWTQHLVPPCASWHPDLTEKRNCVRFLHYEAGFWFLRHKPEKLIFLFLSLLPTPFPVLCIAVRVAVKHANQIILFPYLKLWLPVTFRLKLNLIASLKIGPTSLVRCVGCFSVPWASQADHHCLRAFAPAVLPSRLISFHTSAERSPQRWFP